MVSRMGDGKRGRTDGLVHGHPGFSHSRLHGALVKHNLSPGVAGEGDGITFRIFYGTQILGLQFLVGGKGVVGGNGIHVGVVFIPVGVSDLLDFKDAA